MTKLHDGLIETFDEYGVFCRAPYYRHDLATAIEKRLRVEIDEEELANELAIKGINTNNYLRLANSLIKANIGTITIKEE